MGSDIPLKNKTIMMKITVSINLGGWSFNIDEDAYSELKRYLKNLEIHFATEESSSEILSDIESQDGGDIPVTAHDLQAGY